MNRKRPPISASGGAPRAGKRCGGSGEGNQAGCRLHTPKTVICPIRIAAQFRAPASRAADLSSGAGAADALVA
jgi:hypothetical protein